LRSRRREEMKREPYVWEKNEKMIRLREMGEETRAKWISTKAA
jgi:hypothetical protein